MPPRVGAGVDFVPDRDLPDLSGKVILVTGGTGGLGKAVIHTLIKKNPSSIFVTARNTSRYKSLIDEIQAANPAMKVGDVLHQLKCDLADLQTVQSAAHEVLASPNPQLDIIIGCGGVMFSTPSLTKDGYEVQFRTNHMSHALLIKLLLPLLQKSPDPRIVLFTSGAFAMHPPGGILFDSLHTTQEHEVRLATRWQLYAQSKLALVLYAAELARHYLGVTSVTVHPGEVYTEGFASLGWKDRWLLTAMVLGKFLTPEEGSRNASWAIGAPLVQRQNGNEPAEGNIAVMNGGYYTPIGVVGKHARQSNDKELGKRLWEWTQEELRELN